jgi:hypothetical protein
MTGTSNAPDVPGAAPFVLPHHKRDLLRLCARIGFTPPSAS